MACCTLRMHFLAEAQVGSVMQPQRANTELGEFRRTDDHAPGVLRPAQPTRIQSTAPNFWAWLWNCWGCLFAAGASKVKITESWSRDPISKMAETLLIGLGEVRIGGWSKTAWLGRESYQPFSDWFKCGKFLIQARVAGCTLCRVLISSFFSRRRSGPKKH